MVTVARANPGRSALLALVAWAVALAAVMMTPWAGILATLLWVAVVACIALPGRHRRVLVAAALVAGAATASVVGVQADARAGFVDAAADAGGFVGTVTTKVEPAWEGAWRFEAEVAGITRPVRGLASVVFTGERPPELDLGAVVEIRGSTAPGEAGRRAAIDVRMARAPDVRAAPDGVLAVAASARGGLVRLAENFPGSGAALLPGLAVGETSAVGDDLDAAMKATGLSHLTAVSGANCALVMGAAIAVAAGCGLGRRWRVVIAALALAAFVVLVTPEASVVRAAGMSTIGLIALLSGRRSAGLGLLGTAVTVLLIMDPWLAASIGFALSVAASTALIVLARPLAASLERFMPRPVALMIAVPLAAQLACSPILILISPAISVYGVLANIIAAPAAPVATVLGMLACLAAAVPGVGWALAALAWVPAQWIGSTAELFVALPAVQVPWWEGVGGALALAAVCAALGALLARTRGALTRAAALSILALAVGAGAGLFVVRTVVVPVATPDDWLVAVCDIGQGDALAVRSEGVVMLIDAGPDPDALTACLDRLGIGLVDVFVLTHFDVDHAGGTSALVGRVGLVIHGPWEEPGHGARLTELEQGGAAIRQARVGDALTLGAASARVLWPAAGVSPGNDASVVMEWRAPGLGLVALGDLSAEGQLRLLGSRSLKAPYDVVKVAHHGSADQAERLYTEIGATVGVISVGAENDYGHPRAETITMLVRQGMTVVRTDQAGLVLLERVGDAIGVWTARRASAGRPVRLAPRGDVRGGG